MPSSAVRTFSDPDEYAATVRAAKTEFTVTGRGQFTAKRHLAAAGQGDLSVP
jgi:hypothetical protein